MTKWNRKYGVSRTEYTEKEYKWNRKYGCVEQEIRYVGLSGLGNMIFCQGNCTRNSLLIFILNQSFINET